MDLTIQQLIQDLSDPEITVRIHAATLIGWRGEEAVEAVPALIEMLADEDPRDRRMAALTLGNIGPAASEAIPALLDTINDDEDESVQEMAAEALEKIDVDVEDEDDLRWAA